MSKKNQHFISQFYLNQFTPDDGDQVLWLYSKSDPSSSLWKSPKKVASESYFYSVQRDDGTWDHSLEDQLGDAENDAAPALRRLIEDGYAIAGDRLIIANFIGLTYLRTKAMRDHAVAQAEKLESPEVTIAIIDRDYEYYVSRFGVQSVERFKANAAATGKGLIMHKNFHLDRIFERAAKWGSIIKQMSWTIWRTTPPRFFITSDNPAFARRASDLFTPGIVGLKRRDLGAELGFPLSTRAFLLAKPARSQASKSGGRLRSDCQVSECRKSFVSELNLRTVLSASDHVFLPQRDAGIQALVDQHRGFQLQHPQHTWTS